MARGRIPASGILKDHGCSNHTTPGYTRKVSARMATCEPDPDATDEPA
jgi:hypothetical protein